MSEDGSVVVVASNHPESNGTYNPSGGDYMLIIDGVTGNLISNISGLETKSLKISHDGKYVAIGLQQGNFHIYDLVNQQLHRNVGGSNIYGQVREILWSSDNSSIYMSTGDGYLRKYSLNFTGAISATETWKSYVGGWAFINGLNITNDSNYISVGSKDKGQTVINTSDGTILWSKHTGNFDSKISKDGTKLVTFGGKVYNLTTGEYIGYLNRTATTHFFNNNPFILSVDRATINGSQIQSGITVHSFEGDLLSNTLGVDRFYNPNDVSYTVGEQVQWSYLSDDDSRLIVLSRDMDTANEVGISIFSITNNGGALGIDNESIFSNQIMVFPNPVNNQLNFTFNNTILADIISIQILDINGRIIKNIKTIHPQLSVDLNNLNAGIYLVKVKTTKANYTSKIIKK
ncbi:MAG: T9SS type A sorting domain-containing protein [Flavobacteriaceae bacterium]